MPKVRVKCPACGKTLNVGQKLLGRPIACPACQKQVVFPVLAPAVPAEAELPTFEKPFKTDSIFDEEGPTSVFDEPKPKPAIPVAQGIAPPPGFPAPAAEANPFDFYSAAETVPAPQPSPAAKSTMRNGAAKKKDSHTAPAKSQPSTPGNPFDGSDSEITVSDAASSSELATVPGTVGSNALSASNELRSLTDADDKGQQPAETKPSGRASGAPPLITWIFLAWALLATGAAVYLALHKSSGAKPQAPAVQTK